MHLTSDLYRDKDGYWYGIYKGILGFMVNTEELARLNLEAPADWDDLLKPEYKGLIWMANPNTSGTAKLVINTMVQMKGHDAAMAYLKELDQNIAQYTKSGSGPSKMVGPGECVIGIGFLHDGITQILAGYDNIQLILPASGTSYEVGATAIFKGAKHLNAAKLWVEYALSPECVNLAKNAESYQFLVIDNPEQPAAATAFGLDPNNTIAYDLKTPDEHLQVCGRFLRPSARARTTASRPNNHSIRAGRMTAAVILPACIAQAAAAKPARCAAFVFYPAKGGLPSWLEHRGKAGGSTVKSSSGTPSWYPPSRYC